MPRQTADIIAKLPFLSTPSHYVVRKDCRAVYNIIMGGKDARFYLYNPRVVVPRAPLFFAKAQRKQTLAEALPRAVEIAMAHGWVSAGRLMAQSDLTRRTRGTLCWKRPAGGSCFRGKKDAITRNRNRHLSTQKCQTNRIDETAGCQSGPPHVLNSTAAPYRISGRSSIPEPCMTPTAVKSRA